MRACVLTQKSEEAPASSASLLATPMRAPQRAPLGRPKRASTTKPQPQDTVAVAWKRG